MKMKRYDVIANLIEQFNFKKGAEIGIWKGDTIFHLLKYFPELFIIGVDQWRAYDGFGDKKTTGYIDYRKKKENIEDIKNEVLRKIKKYNNRANILVMSSISAAEYVSDEDLDFVFIDADHRTSFVRADIAVWFPKVKKGGILLGHDWNMKSVMTALTPFKEFLTTIDSDNVWLIEKT